MVSRFITKGKGQGRKVIPIGIHGKSGSAVRSTMKDIRAEARQGLVAEGRRFGKRYSLFVAGSTDTLKGLGLASFPEGVKVTPDVWREKMILLVDMFWPNTYSDFIEAYKTWVDGLDISRDAKDWFREDSDMQEDFSEAVRDTYDMEKDIQMCVVDMKIE